MTKPKQLKFGSREAVFAGKALMTTGKLRKKDLALSRTGKVVSRKKQKRGKGRKNNLGDKLQKKIKST